MSPLDGPRTGHSVLVRSNITREIALDNPNKLAKRFTKFKTNYVGTTIKFPKDIVHPDREVRDAKMFIDVGDIPED